MKEYGLLALIKLFHKFPGHEKKISDLINMQVTSPSPDVQQMAFEFKQLMRKN